MPIRNIIAAIAILAGFILAMILFSPRPIPQNSQPVSNGSNNDQSKVSITNGVKHIVPLDEIVGGGPAKDGIPSIDKPNFISTTNAKSYLKDTDPGILLSLGATHRFYPFQILVWHEIVNDTINNKKVLVTYCPLCSSGVVFDPMVNGEEVQFGTSGKLWNSNLVMYDRKTNTLWSQILGEGLVGDNAGVKLKTLASDIVRFSDFAKLYPDGEVLSRQTGFTRSYGTDPYGDYYTNKDIYFPVNSKDNRLDPKKFVLGIVVDDGAKAYCPLTIKSKGTIEDTFKGKDVVGKYNQDIGAVQLFEKHSDGSLALMDYVGSFWFSWVATHPDTEVYK